MTKNNIHSNRLTIFQTRTQNKDKTHAREISTSALRNQREVFPSFRSFRFEKSRILQLKGLFRICS